MTFFNRITSNSVVFRSGLVILALMLVPALVVAGPDDEAHKHVAKAKIITGNEKAAECISAVHVNAIDGKQVYVQELGFDLEAGKHTLTARTIVNTSFCKAVGPSVGKDKTPPLEADFEAGKTYYVGFDHSSSNRKDWRLVIWKVEG
jgi:hypothetical protein